MESGASVPANPEKRRGNQIARFFHFQEGLSWRGIFHRWQRPIAARVGDACRRTRHCQGRAFCRVSLANEAARALCQCASVFAPERNFPQSRPGRCAEFSARSDGNRLTSGCDAPWWNTRSSRSRAHRIFGGGGGSRCFSKRDATNREFADPVTGDGNARARNGKRTVRTGKTDRSLGIVLRGSDNNERQRG